LTVAGILAAAEAAGVTLRRLPDGRVGARPRKRITPELAAALRSRGPEVAAALPQEPQAPTFDELAILRRGGATREHVEEVLRLRAFFGGTVLSFRRLRQGGKR
jgi:hypothetical protein